MNKQVDLNNAKRANLTKNEAYAIAEFIDLNLFPNIRNDEDTDSMEWLRNMVHGYEKLCELSGYEGLTEGREE